MNAMPPPGTATLRRTAARFTLIEVLTVVVLVAILFTALGSSLRSVLSLREREDSLATDDVVIQACLNRLGQELSAVVPPGEGLSSVFKGTRSDTAELRRDTVEFCCNANPPHSDVFGSDMMQVTYELVDAEDGQGRDLVRAVQRNLLATRSDDPEEVVLLKFVRSLEFTYYDGTDWVDSWDASLQDNAVPRAVRVRIELGDDINVDQLLEMAVPLLVQSVPAADSRGNAAGQGGRP